MNGVLILLDQAGTAIAQLQQRVAELEAELQRRDQAEKPATD